MRRLSSLSRERCRHPFVMQIILALIVFTKSGAGYYTGAAFTSFLYGGSKSSLDIDSVGNPLSFIGTATSALCVLAIFTNFPRRIPFIVKSILLFYSWIAISSVWSNAVSQTAYWLVNNLVYLFATMTIVDRLSPRQSLNAIIASALLITAASVVLCIINPIFTVSLDQPGWRGMFIQKNRFAAFCLYTVIIIFPTLYDGARKGRKLGFIIILLICLILSQGKTSLGIAIAYIMFTYFAILLTLNVRTTILRLLFPFFALATLIGYLIAQGIIDGSITFTGRTILWAWFLSDPVANMAFGAGGLTNLFDPAFGNRAQAALTATTPDSSIVYIIFDFGLIGLAFFCLILLSNWIKVATFNYFYSIFCVGAIISYLVYSGLESDAFLTGGYPTLILVSMLIIAEKIYDNLLAGGRPGEYALASNFAQTTSQSSRADGRRKVLSQG